MIKPKLQQAKSHEFVVSGSVMDALGPHSSQKANCTRRDGEWNPGMESDLTTLGEQEACIASSNKCLTTSNKKLQEKAAF